MSTEDVEILKKKVDRILFYLNNDEDAGQKGLIAEVKGLSSDFADFKNKYERAQAVKKATIGAWATIGGLVALFAKWVITLFF